MFGRNQVAIAFNPDMGAGVVILSNTANLGGMHVEEQTIALMEKMQVRNKYPKKEM